MCYCYCNDLHFLGWCVTQNDARICRISVKYSQSSPSGWNWRTPIHEPCQRHVYSDPNSSRMMQMISEWSRTDINQTWQVPPALKERKACRLRAWKTLLQMLLLLIVVFPSFAEVRILSKNQVQWKTCLKKTTTQCSSIASTNHHLYHDHLSLSL